MTSVNSNNLLGGHDLNDLEIVKSEDFGELNIDIYENDEKELYMTREQIGKALEYKNPQKAINNIHKRHKDRLEQFSVTLKLRGTDGKQYDTILYTYKGIYEICRLSRQPKADKFIDWVWDVVEEIRTKGYYALTNQQEVKQIEINPDNINKAYEQASFIAGIMEEAGVSGQDKLIAVKNIYEAMGINLFDRQKKLKSRVDYEIEDLVKELAEKLTEYQCKFEIIEIYNDKTISDKIRYGSMYVYFMALKMIRDKYLGKLL